jgi:hypothetical protein
MMLALTRLWDKRKDAIRMDFIANTLRKTEVIDALALDRVKHLNLPEAFDEMKNDLRRKTDEVVRLVNKYKDNGAHHPVLKELLGFRNERLAHRQLAETTAPGASATDEHIAEFYQDNLKLVHLLLSVVNAVSYDPEETAKIYRLYASQFWGALQNVEIRATVPADGSM